MKNTLLAIFCTVFIFGCTDDNSVNYTLVGNGYFPLTLGSNWIFETQFENAYEKYSIAFKDSIIHEKFQNGLRYVFLDTKVSDSTNRYITNTGFYRRSNDTIYKGQFFYYVDTLVNVDYPIVESIFLIERKGASWSVTIPAMPNSYTQNFTVVDKGIKYAVDSILYNDVLHVHVTNTAFNSQGTISTTEWDQYYAKDIGLIQSGKTKLKSYSIK
jgi:hypothetical protein